MTDLDRTANAEQLHEDIARVLNAYLDAGGNASAACQVLAALGAGCQVKYVVQQVAGIIANREQYG